MNDLKPVILVDGSTYLFRAFHALPRLYTSKGVPTNVTRGVASMLNKLRAQNEGSTIVVVFDAPGKTFRDEAFPEYKATRPPIDPDLVAQIDATHEVVKTMGFPLVMVPDVEADDVIGTLATQAEKRGQRTIISTSDKDMSQLVNDSVWILDANENIVDSESVIDKFGVRPDQIIDLLALMGDKVDNIPGIPRVGIKTAAKWLQEYEDIEGILKNQDNIKGKVGESLREHAKQIPQSRWLATIKCDVELDQTIAELEYKTPDIEALTKLYEELEFNSLLRDLQSTAENREYDAVELKIIRKEEEFKDFCREIKRQQVVSLVVESDEVAPGLPQLIGLGLCCTRWKAVYLPLTYRHDRDTWIGFKNAVSILKETFNSEPIKIIGNDLKTVKKVMHGIGVEFHGELLDTRMMSYVLNSVVADGHSTEALTRRMLAREITDRKTITGTGAKKIEFSQTYVEDATKYMAEQAWGNFMVAPKLQDALEESPELLKLYTDLEVPFIDVLLKLEWNGVRLNEGVLRVLSHELTERITAIVEEAFDLAGETFSLASPKQLQVMLYDKLQLPAPKPTKTGNRSTAEDVLRDIVANNPDHPYIRMPQLVLEFRNATKLKSTYTDQLPDYVNPLTLRVHSSYDQANASTGRLASYNPNLQNIPIRTNEGRRIRQAFIAAEGCRLVAADYSQIELRVMAHLSGDAGLQRAFSAGLDIHRATAGEVFGIDYDDVDDEHRRRAKAINFGLMYGMSAFGLARNLGIERDEAQAHIDLYFEHYPGIRDYMDRTRETAREQKFVTTVAGRRIYLNQIDSRNFQLRQGAERLAINAPVQGTAADIIKRASIGVDRFLTETKIKAKLILHVHDEMVFDVVEADVEQLKTGVEEIMRNAGQLNVPLVVDFGVGENWDEAH